MKKAILNLSLILAIVGSVGIMEGKTLKKCKSKKDKISGCVAWQYHVSPLGGLLLAEIPYKNGKENGVIKGYYPSKRLALKGPVKNGKASGTMNDVL